MDKYDLFRVLTRSSYEEVVVPVMHGDWVHRGDHDRALQEFVEPHGWTVEEFRAERKRRYNLCMDEIAKIAKEIDKQGITYCEKI